MRFCKDSNSTLRVQGDQRTWGRGGEWDCYDSGESLSRSNLREYLLILQVSDVVSLEDRGKYQGFISAACSLGTAVGPFVGGGLATAGQWRWLFW